jgi:CheY-like chemotaxis protein
MPALHVMKYGDGWVIKHDPDEAPSLIISQKSQAIKMAKTMAAGHGGWAILLYKHAGQAPEELKYRKRRERVLESSTTKTILFVDDNEIKRYAASRYLRHAKFNVVESYCAADALRLIQCEPPDVVVSDICLPQMDGYDLCRQIKELAPNVPVLLISAQVPDHENVERCGAEGFIGDYDAFPQAIVLAVKQALHPAS